MPVPGERHKYIAQRQHADSNEKRRYHYLSEWFTFTSSHREEENTIAAFSSTRKRYYDLFPTLGYWALRWIAFPPASTSCPTPRVVLHPTTAERITREKMATKAFFNILDSFFMRVGFQRYESNCFLSVANFNSCGGFFGWEAKQGRDLNEKNELKRPPSQKATFFALIT